MAEEIDLFGEYALLIAQLLTLVSIGGIFIQFARWINKHKNFARDTTFFVILVIVIISTNVLGVLRISTLEQQQLVNQNIALTNQETLKQNQQTLIDNSQTLEKILNATAITNKNLLHDGRYRVIDPPLR